MGNDLLANTNIHMYCIMDEYNLAVKDATTAHISREYQNLFIYRTCLFVGITNTITR
jgi:hypothetical protein